MAKELSVAKLTLESSQYEKKLKEARNQWQNFAKQLGISIGKFTAAGAAIGAVTAAVKVAKDAFSANESAIDSWGKTIESARSVYQSFLSGINSGDMSGFLKNMQSIIDNAKAAYEALDALETKQILNSEKVGKQATENERMRAMLRSGRYIAPTDGTKPIMESGQLLTKEQKEQIAKRLENGMNALISYQRDELSSTTKAIAAKERELAGELGTTVNEFKKWTADNDALVTARANYEKYAQFELKHTVTRGSESGITRVRDNAVNPYQKYANLEWTTRFVEEGDAFTAIRQLREQANSLSRTMYSQQFQAFRAINSATNAGAGSSPSSVGKAVAAWQRIAMGDVGGIALGRSVKDVKSDLAAAQTMYDEAGDEFGRAAADVLIKKFQEELGRIGDEGSPFKDAYAHDFSKDLERLNAGKERQERTEMKLGDVMSSVAGGVNGMLGGIEQLGIDLPEGMKDVVSSIQGVASILTGISAMVSVIQGITAVDALIPFSTGGVVKAANGFRVPGNYFSGDQVPAMLNSGEVVLNRAQQGNLISQLGGGGSMGGAQPYVDGEKIWLGLSNYLKRSGKGEIVVSKR